MPTGLAGGLALKELRYVEDSRRFAPGTRVGPCGFPAPRTTCARGLGWVFRHGRLQKLQDLFHGSRYVALWQEIGRPWRAATLDGDGVGLHAPTGRGTPRPRGYPTDRRTPA